MHVFKKKTEIFFQLSNCVKKVKYTGTLKKSMTDVGQIRKFLSEKFNDLWENC